MMFALPSSRKRDRCLPLSLLRGIEVTLFILSTMAYKGVTKV